VVILGDVAMALGPGSSSLGCCGLLRTVTWRRASGLAMGGCWWLAADIVVAGAIATVSCPGAQRARGRGKSVWALTWWSWLVVKVVLPWPGSSLLGCRRR